MFNKIYIEESEIKGKATWKVINKLTKNKE